MNIWIVNAYAIPPSQAGGTRHFTLAKHLARLGHGATLFAGTQGLAMSRSQELPDEVEGVRFRWVRVPPYFGNGLSRVRNMLAFRSRLASVAVGKPDLVLGSSPHLFAAQGAARLARKHSCPFVLEVRDIWPQTLVDMGFSPWHPFVWWQKQIERELYQAARGLVTLLPGSESYFRESGFRGPILTLPNGIDLAAVPAPRPEPEGPFEVLYAGAHGAANGLDVVLEASRLLPDVRFTLLGDGPAKAKLREQGRGLPNLTFEDPVPKAHIHERLSRAHVLLHVLADVKVFKHGVSPNKMFDYMAAGRPVVVSASVEGSPVQLADCGIQIPAGNAEALAEAIRKLQNLGREGREALGAKGRAYVEEHHDLGRSAQRLSEFLAGLPN
jgi:glycosyltransferase involved in cell wall biosynthesis